MGPSETYRQWVQLDKPLQRFVCWAARWHRIFPGDAKHQGGSSIKVPLSVVNLSILYRTKMTSPHNYLVFSSNFWKYFQNSRDSSSIGREKVYVSLSSHIVLSYLYGWTLQYAGAYIPSRNVQIAFKAVLTAIFITRHCQLHIWSSGRVGSSSSRFLD